MNHFPILILCRTLSASAQNRWIVGSESESSTKNPHTSSAKKIEHEKTLQLRQPIRIENYVTRVVSQSESSSTSPESSWLGWKTLLDTRPLSARYSLSYILIHRVCHQPPPPPPPPPDQLTHLLLSDWVTKNRKSHFVRLIKTRWISSGDIPFQRHPGIQTEKSRGRIRIAPRMILILKWVSPWANPHRN